MHRHQAGLFAEGTVAHQHVELTLRPGVDLADLRAAVAQVRLGNANRRANGGAHAVLGFGPELWGGMAGDLAPAGLRPFPGYGSSEGAHAPSTQRDLWIWAHGPSPDRVFDVARAAADQLGSLAEVVTDQPSWVYRDSRDLSGFIDGTANPILDRAPIVALVPDGQPGTGGAHAMTMRWVHDLDGFSARPLEEQEGIFGRTKSDSIELDPKPADSHVARVEIETEDGELEIYRRSVAFGTTLERGLWFVAFAADAGRFDIMLRNMFGQGDDGLVDRLTTWTRPVTGSYWFCPSLDDLDAVCGPLPEQG